MRRLAILSLLVAMASPAAAQGIWYTAPPSRSSSSGFTVQGGQLLLQAGTPSNPSWAWEVDPDTGMLHIADNYVGFYAGAGVKGIYNASQWIFYVNQFTLGASNGSTFIKPEDAHIMVYRTGAPQTFSVGGSWSNTTNYAAYGIAGTANGFNIRQVSSGTGVGSAQDGLISIQGSKVVALSEGSATTVGTVTVSDGAPFLGKAIYGAFCSDGTDSVSRAGEVTVSCVSKAGTVVCTEYTSVASSDAASGGASFSSFTVAVTEGSNSAALTIDATCSLTPTSLDGYVVWQNLTTNSVLPGT